MHQTIECYLYSLYLTFNKVRAMFNILNQKVDYPLQYLLGFNFSDLPLKSIYQINNEPSLTLISELFTDGGSKLAISEQYKPYNPLNEETTIEDKAKALEEIFLRHNINKTIQYTYVHSLNEELNRLIELDLLFKLDNQYVFFDNQIEIPSNEVRDYIFDFQINNLKPILVFPEKNNLYNSKIDRLNRLFDRGVLFQIDWLSLTGFYGNSAQKTATHLLETEAIKFIGFERINLFKLFKDGGCKISKKVAGLLDNQLFSSGIESKFS